MSDDDLNIEDFMKDPRFEGVVKTFAAATTAYLQLIATMGIDIASVAFALPDTQVVTEMIGACVLRLSQESGATMVEIQEMFLAISRAAHEKQDVPMYHEQNIGGGLFEPVEPIYSTFVEHATDEGDVEKFRSMYLDHTEAVQVTPDEDGPDTRMHFFDIAED